MSGDIMRESLQRITSLGPRRTGPTRCDGWAAGSPRGTGCRAHPLCAAASAALAGRGRSCCCSSSRSWRSRPSSRSARSSAGWQTLVLLLVESAARRVAGPARRGTAPGQALTHGAQHRADAEPAARRRGPRPVGGTLLLTPGFLTDVVGLLLHPAVHPARSPGACSRPWSPSGCSAGVFGGRRGPGVRRPLAASGRRPDVIEGEVLDSRARGIRGTTKAAPRSGTRPSRAWCGSGGALAPRLLAAGLAQEHEALLEELLELGDGATLEQHVPVGADVLDLLGLGLGAVDETGLLAAPALPGRGISASTEKGSSVRWPCGHT